MLGVSPVYRWCVAVYREINIILLNKKTYKFAYHNFEDLTNLAHLYRRDIPIGVSLYSTPTGTAYIESKINKNSKERKYCVKLGLFQHI